MRHFVHLLFYCPYFFFSAHVGYVPLVKRVYERRFA